MEKYSRLAIVTHANDASFLMYIRIIAANVNTLCVKAPSVSSKVRILFAWLKKRLFQQELVQLCSRLKTKLL